MDRPREPFDEKQMISRVLREAQGDLRLAAQHLDIHPELLRRKVIEHQLEADLTSDLG